MKTDITGLLVRCYAETAEEKQTQAAFVTALKEDGGSLLSRKNTARHITVSALVTDPDMEKVLMVHHNLYDAYTWPGGHADEEENLLAAALREVREETGIKTVSPLTSVPLSADILPVPAHEKNGASVPAHSHYSVTFACIASEKQPLSIKADENSAVTWIAADKLEKFCREAHMLPLYQKVYTRARQIQQKKQACYGMLADTLLPWYRNCARALPWRKDRDPYHVWVSEIMLQQTRVEAVLGYYSRFLEAAPTIEALAALPQERLIKLWEGLGYYTRAKNLQKAAKIIVEKYGGQFPAQYEQMLELPGIGTYTAGALASICYELPVPAVDGNVLRVLARITELYTPVDTPSAKNHIAASLSRVYPSGECGDFTQALMELGATICLPGGQPQCTRCPANGFCMAYANGSVQDLPKRTPKRARRAEKRTVFILICDDKIALERRGEGGLLSGLWQLPNIDEKITENEALQTAAEWGACPARLIKSVEKKHIFTHIQWHMTGYYIQCRAQAKRFTWASRQQLKNEIALPTAFKIFTEKDKAV